MTFLLLLGWFGFGSTVAGIIGSFCVGALSDTRRFQRSVEIFMIASLIGCILSIIWFELCVHTTFFEKPILSSTPISIGLSTALAGFFQGASTPLIYEALAETMFPLPEAISALAINQWNNVSSLVLLFVAPHQDKLMNLLVLIVVGACILMVCVSLVLYERRDENQRKLFGKQQEVLNDDDNSSTCVDTAIHHRNLKLRLM
ncbi:unnamed protein product [Rotaria sp. Silwood1]|nr:unnamed protein product [Rotaria sp. Silwood1]